MVQSKNILSLLVLPTLALSSPSLHQRHAHHHHQERAINWVYTTEIVATTTVTAGHIPTDAPKAEVNEIKANVNEAAEQRPAQKATLIVTPVPVVPTPAPELAEAPEEPAPPAPPAPKPKPTSTSVAAPKPKPKPTDTAPPSSGGGYPSGIGGQFAIKNNCKYDLTMTIDRTKCGPIERNIPIAAGETWYGDITSCMDANPAYKIYKVSNGKRDAFKPLQLEAGFKPDQNTLWYNISPKDCVNDMYGAGIDECPGGPWYLNAVSTASNPGACQTFQCHDAQSCCTSSLGAYCDAWASAAKALGGEEPVGGCLGDLNQIALVAQLC
jgi:hypothetical protein